jgi:ribose transport system substrate-binding protein
VTTSTQEAPAVPDPAARPQTFRPRAFSPVSLLIIALLGAALLWTTGVFKGSPQVAIVTSGEGPYWDPVINGAEDAAAQNNVKLKVIRSKSDTGIQSQHMQELLRRRPAGIAVSPLDPDFQSTVLADVAANTTLVTFDSDSPVSRRLCFVGTDNYAAGRLLGEAVKAALPDGGEVIISLGFPHKDNTQRRRQGVIDELLDRPVDPQKAWEPMDQPIKGEKYTIVATLADDSIRERATTLAAEALSKYPNVKCFIGLVSYSAPMVSEAIKKAEKAGQVKVVGFDVDDRTLAGIEAGTIEATVMQDQYGLGYHAVRILAAEANGNRGELPAYQMHVLPCKLVTKANLEQARRELISPRQSDNKPGPPPSQSAAAASGTRPS